MKTDQAPNYQAILSEAVERKAFIVVYARCEVNYSGRAESYLPLGERVIVIKSDGTVLIHQPTGNTPVNYMKEGASINLTQHEGRLLLSVRQGKEYLDVTIHRVISFDFHNLDDDGKLQLVGSEKDMADMLFSHPDMIERGFRPLSREEHTKYGFIDLFGYDKEKVLVIVECKRYGADLKAVSQLRRYVERIKKSKGLDKVRGIIAAPKISGNARKMLEDWGFSFAEVKPPKYLERHDKNQAKLFDF